MKLIPAISIKRERVVVAENGQYAFLKNSEGQYRNPVNMIQESEFPGEEVFILDIDGLERNNPDLDMVKHIASFKDVWLDAGIGDADSMMDAFVSDASKVVMGTICMRSLDELRKALEISDDVIFSMGYDGGIVSPDSDISGASVESVLDRLGDVPKMNIGLFFDLGGIRDRKAPDVTTIASVIPKFNEFYVSGYLEKGNIAELEDAGVTGIIADFRTLEALKDE